MTDESPAGQEANDTAQSWHGHDRAALRPGSGTTGWKDGKDNLPSTVTAGDASEATFPRHARRRPGSRRIPDPQHRYLADENAVNRQFLDVGTGLPTADNTH